MSAAPGIIPGAALTGVRDAAARVSDTGGVRSRGRIIEATLGLVGEGGFDAVTIASAAHAAGVTRQTVYSNFGSREELLSQAMGELTVRTYGGIRARIEPDSSSAEYVAELIVAGRAVVRTDPVLRRLLRIEPGNPLLDPGMLARAKPIARALFEPLEHRALPVGLDDIVEMALMLAIPVVFFDEDPVRSDDDLRAFLLRWLRPALAGR